MGHPRRIWWARPGKLCALERPGGGGRTHRADARAADIAYLRASGAWLVVSTMRTRHNLADYEAAGLAWHHVPVAGCAEGEDALEELLPLLRRELRRRGAVAVHGDLRTDFPAAVCAAHLHEARGMHPAAGLAEAAAAGLEVTEEAARLLGVDHEELLAPPPAAAAGLSAGSPAAAGKRPDHRSPAFLTGRPRLRGHRTDGSAPAGGSG